MKSGWVEADAQALVDQYERMRIGRELALRVYTTRLLGRDPVGCFLAGCMGAVWDRDRGIPPLGLDAILALCNAI